MSKDRIVWEDRLLNFGQCELCGMDIIKRESEWKTEHMVFDLNGNPMRVHINCIICLIKILGNEYREKILEMQYKNRVNKK